MSLDAKRSLAERGHVRALIPAQGGSQGLPRRNIRTFFGKSLIAWTIEAALRGTFSVEAKRDDNAETCYIMHAVLRHIAILSQSEAAATLEVQA